MVKVYNLCRVSNYSNSRAHGQEQHGKPLMIRIVFHKLKLMVGWYPGRVVLIVSDPGLRSLSLSSQFCLLYMLLYQFYQITAFMQINSIPSL